MEPVALAAFIPDDTELQNVKPATLQQCADKIDQHVNQTRQELFQLLQALLGQDDPTTERDLQEALSVLCSATHFVPGSAEASIADLAQQYRVVAAEMQEGERKLGGLKLAAELEKELADFNRHVAAGQLQDAAYCVAGLTRTLQGADEASSELVSAALGASLHKECSACSARLLQVLDERVQQAVVLDTSRSCLAVGAPSGPGEGGGLMEVWASLQLLGELTPRLEDLAGKVLQQVVAPLLTSSSCRVDISPGPPAMLHWDLQPTLTPSSGSPGVHIESALQKVFAFLAEHVLGSEVELTRAFGEVLWGPLVGSYHQLRVQPLLADPTCSADVADHVSEAAAQLEEFASCIGFVAEEGALAAVVGDCMRAMQHRRQEVLLAEARAVLGARAWEGRPQGEPLQPDLELLQRCSGGELQEWEQQDPPCGWDPSSGVLPTGSCPVTDAALQLQQLLERAVSQASAASSVPAAQAMCTAAENIARMARTMPRAGPKGRQVASVPQMALLLHNDLQHLASALLLCTMRQAPALRASLGDCPPTGLLEAAMALRAAAGEVLAEQVAAQQQQLQELMAPLGAFRANLSGGAAPAHRKALQQVQHSVSRLGRTLLEVLPPCAMMEAAGQVLGHLAASICRDVIAKRNIASEESAQLAGLLRPLAEDAVRQLLGGSKQQDAVEVRYGLSIEQVASMISARCIPMQKLQLLLVALDARMVDIVEMWEEGQLQGAGFTKYEVLRLIKALFEDTHFRQECIERVLRAAVRSVEQ